MIASESLSVSKSLLAKLMATENLTVEEKNVRTASFDVKNRVLTIPILDQSLSPSLYDLFTGHEVGHALWTTEEGIRKAMALEIPTPILNLVEDSRIERKIKNKYPGLRKSFVQAYSELVDRDFFGTKDVDLNELNFIDRTNMHCKGGAGLNIKFNDIEKQLVKEIESTETFDEVIQVSLRVYDYCKELQDKQEELKKMLGADEGENDSDDYEYSDESEDPQYDEEESSDVEEQNDKPGDSGTEEDSGSGGGDSTNASGNKSSGQQFRSFTDEAYKRNEEKLFKGGNTNYTYVNIPKVDTKQAILDCKDFVRRYRKETADSINPSYYEPDYAQFLKLKKDISKVVSYLVKEFEMRKNAEQLKRATVAKTGELNMSKIYSYKFSEDIFKKISVVPGGKSHGLVMFLDWSGSMSNHLSNTVKQLLSLVMFCKKVNIPYEVYAFTNNDYLELYQPEKKAGDLRLGRFRLMNILSSRMTASEFTYSASVLTTVGSREGRRCLDFFCLSGTPLNETVIAALEIVPEFQKKNKLQIVNTIFLTDGDGHPLRNFYENVSGEIVENSFDYRGTIILRDPETKTQEMCDATKWGSTDMTKSLIKMLRSKTGSHVIGFYVLFSREFQSAGKFFSGGVDMFIKKEEFKKNKFCIVKNSGYDEYYLLKSELRDDDEPEFTVRENATTKGLVNAFTKYTNGRVTNRVVLNRFIGLIS